MAPLERQKPVTYHQKENTHCYYTANNSWWFLSTFLVKGCAGGTFCLYYQYISNAWTVSWALDLKDYWYEEDSANRDQTPIKCLGISNNFFMVSIGNFPMVKSLGIFARRNDVAHIIY